MIVACLGARYLEQREAGKLFNREFVRAHARERDLGWSWRSGVIIEAVHDMVSDLMRRGIYRASLDPARIAILIMSLTGCPVRLLETLGPRWFSEQDLGDPCWIAEVAAMIDGSCLAS